MLQFFNHNKLIDLFPRQYLDNDLGVSELWTLSRSYEQQVGPAHMGADQYFRPVAEGFFIA